MVQAPLRDSQDASSFIFNKFLNDDTYVIPNQLPVNTQIENKLYTERLKYQMYYNKGGTQEPFLFCQNIASTPSMQELFNGQTTTSMHMSKIGPNTMTKRFKNQEVYNNHLKMQQKEKTNAQLTKSESNPFTDILKKP